MAMARVPTDLAKAMAESRGSRFLIDGFPRNADNLHGLIAVIDFMIQVSLSHQDGTA